MASFQSLRRSRRSRNVDPAREGWAPAVNARCASAAIEFECLYPVNRDEALKPERGSQDASPGILHGGPSAWSAGGSQGSRIKACSMAEAELP